MWKPGDRVLVDPLPLAHGPKGMIGEMYDGGRAEYCCAWAPSCSLPCSTART